MVILAMQIQFSICTCTIVHTITMFAQSLFHFFKCNVSFKHIIYFVDPEFKIPHHFLNSCSSDVCSKISLDSSGNWSMVKPCSISHFLDSLFHLRFTICCWCTTVLCFIFGKQQWCSSSCDGTWMFVFISTFQADLIQIYHALKFHARSFRIESIIIIL